MYVCNTLESKKLLLIKFLNSYLSKYQIGMKHVMINMIYRLKKGEQITLKQLQSALPYVEREPLFINMNRDQIIRYFDEIIEKPYLKTKENLDDNTKSTLEPFFTKWS